MNIPPSINTIIGQQPYPLLFAIISGSHLYGFPSPDSDYDLRGVPEMLNPNTKLYISSYTNSKKAKLVNITSSPQTNEHN